MSFSIISDETRVAHLDAMSHLAANPGMQRGLAEKALSKIGDGYAFVISYGKGVQAINGKGLPYVGRVDEFAEGKVTDKESSAPSVIHDDPAGMEVGIATELQTVVVAGSAPLNKIVGSIHIPCGICVIVAKAGAGKTPLAHRLAGAGVKDYAVVRVGEPFAGYTTNRRTVARDLGRAMVARSDVVLDSVKDLLADSGSAMKGGIARAALVDLSAWATQAAALGCTIYIPLNPSGDEDLIRLMTEAAKSNSTMTISHRSGTTWEYSSRTGEGLERLTGTYEFTRPVTTTPSSADREFLVSFNADKVSRADLAGLLKRTRTL